MAPSITALARNRPSEIHRTRVGMRTPERNSCVSARHALTRTLSNPPAKIAAERQCWLHQRYGREPAVTPAIALLKTLAPRAREPPSRKTKGLSARIAGPPASPAARATAV